MNKSGQGTTLLELLIVMAISGVLLSLGISGYVSIKNRQDIKQMQMVLMQAQAEQHAYYLQHGEYATADQLHIADSDDYALSVSELSSDYYVLTATLAQKSGNDCETLSVDAGLIQQPHSCW